jgi:hypothetical protein
MGLIQPDHSLMNPFDGEDNVADHSQAQATVDAMVAALGIVPTVDERVQLVRIYEAFRPLVDALYEVPETRYEFPALVFRAMPELESWDGEK